MDLRTLLDTPPWDWPRDAGKVLQKILTNPRAQAADRIIAADLAGDLVVINDELAYALMAIVGNADEAPELRAKAAISFGPALEVADTEEFDDPDAVPISEDTYHTIQELLQRLYLDQNIPKEVRRRILEASVRSPEPWHASAILAAYSSGDREWILTAVFAMRYVHEFDGQILEALKSSDPEIHYEAVKAAGEWELDAAWSHVVALVNDPGTPKDLLLAAIEAVGSICPAEAPGILMDLADSDDEEIAEAAGDAIAMAEAGADEDFEEDLEEDEDEWIN